VYNNSVNKYMKYSYHSRGGSE